MSLGPLRRVLLQVAREQRPIALDLAEDVVAQPRVLAEEPARPFIALQRASAPPAGHPRTLQRQVLDRIDERVVLAQPPPLPEQAVELRGVRPAQSAGN